MKYEIKCFLIKTVFYFQTNLTSIIFILFLINILPFYPVVL